MAFEDRELLGKVVLTNGDTVEVRMLLVGDIFGGDDDPDPQDKKFYNHLVAKSCGRTLAEIDTWPIVDFLKVSRLLGMGLERL
jgi:hypothetical protein